MIYRVLFVLCFILPSCKKDDENKPYNITITGVVTDQVTGQPVAGATVSLGLQPVSVLEEGLMAPKAINFDRTGWKIRAYNLDSTI